MSFYVIIASAAIEITAQVLTGIAAVILLAKANQSSDATRKNALRTAAVFTGLGIAFAILTMISTFIVLASRGCKKRRIGLIIFLILLLISLIIGEVITYVYMKQSEEAGDGDSARDLRAAFTLVLVALGLHVLAFILFYVVIGRRFSQIGKTCKQVKQQTGGA